MGTVGDYLQTIDGPDRAALERIYAIARDVVPGTVEGTSYAMAALMYRGKGLVAAVQGRKFLSCYPFSGSVVGANIDKLAGFTTTTGSIHFSAAEQLPEPVLRCLLEARRDEIDASAR